MKRWVVAVAAGGIRVAFVDVFADGGVTRKTSLRRQFVVAAAGFGGVVVVGARTSAAVSGVAPLRCVVRMFESESDAEVRDEELRIHLCPSICRGSLSGTEPQAAEDGKEERLWT